MLRRYIWKKFYIKGAALVAPFVLIFLTLNFLFPLPDIFKFSTIIYDRNSRLISQFLSDDGYNRIKVDPEDAPQKLKLLAIFKEDKRFYYHFGVDPIAIIRAIYQNIKAGKIVSGGSTITMQTARLLEKKDRTLINKLIEIFRSFQLELKYTKEEILLLYFSLAPYGGNVEGINSASLFFYHTFPTRLNLAQLIDLTIIPNSPNYFNPEKNYENLFVARRKLAYKAYRKKIISEQEYHFASKFKETIIKKPLIRNAPHFSIKLKKLYPDNNKISSSLDLEIQYKFEKACKAAYENLISDGANNIAAIAIKNSTCEIIAYVGSPDFYNPNISGQYDCVQAIRSPGSLLKPFLFAQRINKGELTPKTILLDVPDYSSPENVENFEKKYYGTITAEEALLKSLNAPFVLELKREGLESFLKLLTTLQFKTIEKNKNKLGLSAITGGCGTKLEELISAYSIFPNGGIYKKISYLKIDKNNSYFKVFDYDAAYLTVYVLSKMIRKDIPSEVADYFLANKIAYKTGTSYGRRDIWSIGFNREYTIGIWIGNSKNSGMKNLTGANAAAPLLFSLFNSFEFKSIGDILLPSETIVSRLVCSESGLEPNEYCKTFTEDLFSLKFTKLKKCDWHKKIYVDKSEKFSYCARCLIPEKANEKIFLVYPRELTNFWKKNKIVFESPPPHNPECPFPLNPAPPEIISPLNNSTIYLFNPSQKVVVSALCDDESYSLNWTLNGKLLNTINPDQSFLLDLNSGEYELECSDIKGRKSKTKFKVVKAY